MAESQKESLLRVSNETMFCLNQTMHSLEGTTAKIPSNIEMNKTVSEMLPSPEIFNKTAVCEFQSASNKFESEYNITDIKYSNLTKARDIINQFESEHNTTKIAVDFVNELPNGSSALLNNLYMQFMLNDCYGDMKIKFNISTEGINNATDLFAEYKEAFIFAFPIMDFITRYHEALLLNYCNVTEQDLGSMYNDTLDKISAFLDTLEENKTEPVGEVSEVQGE